MSEKKCPHCATMIPSEAKICPNCRKRQGMHWGIKVLIGLFLLFVIGKVIETSNKSTPGGPVSSTSSGISGTPALELQTWHWGESYSHAIAEGAVRNISDQKMNNVVAV